MLIKDRNICNGKLIINGTRLTYETVIAILNKMTVFEAMAEYPTLDLDGIIDCLIELKGCYTMKNRTLKEYKKDVFDKLDDNKKLEYMYEMSKNLCDIAEYAKKTCDEYLEDDYPYEYCDGTFASCKKILELIGEDISKYE